MPGCGLLRPQLGVLDGDQQREELSEDEQAHGYSEDSAPSRERPGWCREHERGQEGQGVVAGGISQQEAADGDRLGGLPHDGAHGNDGGAFHAIASAGGGFDRGDQGGGERSEQVGVGGCEDNPQQSQEDKEGACTEENAPPRRP
jgi:hypothetical protein